MLKSNIGRGLLLAVGALAMIGAVYSMRRAVAAARAPVSGAQPGAAEAAPAKPEGADAAVIRFVKDPQIAPPFHARDLAGDTVSLADLKGKVVVLNFWATWCGPCREEIPEMIELQAEFKDQFQVVGASEDDDPPETVLKFVKKMGMNYPIFMASAELIKSYGGVPALPTSFLIDTQGRVVQKHTGLYPIESYDREIRYLLGMPNDARVETFEDTGQVFLKNAANATELPGVSFAGLTDAQKKAALRRLNAEDCTCGCGLTLAECRINDTECPVSGDLANQVVKEVRAGNAAAPAAAQTPSSSPSSSSSGGAAPKSPIPPTPLKSAIPVGQ